MSEKLDFVVLVSTAAQYADDSFRTMGGVVPQEFLRTVQIDACFRKMPPRIGSMYFAGADVKTDDNRIVQIDAPDKKEALSYRVRKAIEVTVEKTDTPFIFICHDDTFTHLSRLDTFIKELDPDTMIAVGGVSDKWQDCLSTGAGILIPTVLAKEMLTDTAFGTGSDADEDISRCISRVGGKMFKDSTHFKFGKTIIPHQGNALITAHHMNIYDMWEAYARNIDTIFPG